MASIKSLGIRKPAGLHYLIQEGILTPDCKASDYAWDTFCSQDADTGDDEVLYTKTCVVWSNGGVVRNSYRFEHEAQTIKKALISRFLVDSTKKYHASTNLSPPPTTGSPNSAKSGSKSKEYRKALVIFLESQAHVYYMSGASYIIHLPFEVETALATPYGVIVQRKLIEKAPILKHSHPRESLASVISQSHRTSHSFSMNSSPQSVFSVDHLGNPKQLNLDSAPYSAHRAWQTVETRDDSTWPRLFSITDPLAEMGLVVVDDRRHGKRRISPKAYALDPDEEILFVGEIAEMCDIEGHPPVILATTVHRKKDKLTIWRVEHLPDNTLPRSRRTPRVSRRRSSRIVSATPTPAVMGQNIVHDSFLSHRLRDDHDISEEIFDFAAALDPDFAEIDAPRRKSRRVSSMLARADLSHDAGQVKRRGESLASQHVRASFGRSTINGYAHNNLGASINSMLESSPNDILKELRETGDLDSFQHMGLEDDDFEGLRHEFVFSRIESIPIEHTNVNFAPQKQSAVQQFCAFTIASPETSYPDPPERRIMVCILDKFERSLVVVPLILTHEQIDRTVASPTTDGSIKTAGKARIEVTSLVASNGLKRAHRVLDACKLTDGTIERILLLTETDNGQGQLTLQGPWSQMIGLHFPSRLMFENARSGVNEKRSSARREEFKRALRDPVKAFIGLKHASIHGTIDLLDDEGSYHELQIQMQARNPEVGKLLEMMRSFLPGPEGGEQIRVAWWNVLHHLRDNPDPYSFKDEEWTALVVLLMSMLFALRDKMHASHRRWLQTPRKSQTRMGSFPTANDSEWTTMLALENYTRKASQCGSAWQWLGEEGGSLYQYSTASSGKGLEIAPHSLDRLEAYVFLTERFLESSAGQEAFGNGAKEQGYLPFATNVTVDKKSSAVTSILRGLHTFHEELKLNVAVSDVESDCNVEFVPVLAQLFAWAGWTKWFDLYLVEDAGMTSWKISHEVLVDLPEPQDPPEVYQWLEGCFTSRQSCDTATGPFATPRWRKVMPRTSLLAQYFQSLSPTSTPTQMVEELHRAGLTSGILDTLPDGVTVLVRESIAACQANPSASWSRPLLQLIDREDVSFLLCPEATRSKGFGSVLAPSHDAASDISTICLGLQDTENVSAFDGSAEVDRDAITQLIWKDDRRFLEAVNILSTSKPTIARLQAPDSWTESRLLEEQKKHVTMLATRTLAKSTGRGLLHFRARVPLLTEKFPIAAFNLHAVIQATNTTIGIDKTLFTEELTHWAFFHSGVAAGLSISRDAKGIDTSWILFNKPHELTNRHAGFLLALGLNGHLKTLSKVVCFRYLTPKHPMTSIGLLLGLAASYLGTMDSLITRLLSVHITRMLPAGAAELNLSALTQTAGIMGVGLVYCNTQHRRMSEIMLSEVEHVEPEFDEEPLRNEGYRLAAGFALGLINLGHGRDLQGLHDMHLVERLLQVGVGGRKVSMVHILDKSSAAAVVALSFIFMKTSNASLAQKIDIPESQLQYAYIRPDMFLLRTLARHLIMWHDIEPTNDWIKRMLPVHLQPLFCLGRVQDLDSGDLPLYRILTGVLFAIALRHAGSGSVLVRDLLLHYLDQMYRICQSSAMNFDQKLTRLTVRDCLDLIALGVSTVMAGTGDLPTFRRLRALHGRDDPDTHYGSHLAAHAAVGALFLGGGTHTFSTSNIAVASLIVAFYPLFPSTILDNKCHLQAFRHFWVLATDSRCLVPRDLDTNRPVRMPMQVTSKSGETLQLYAPCLLPELELIGRIETLSEEYWNIVLDFSDPRIQTAFAGSQDVCVRRRAPTYGRWSTALRAHAQSVGTPKAQSLSWLFQLASLALLTQAQIAAVLGPEEGSAAAGLGIEATDVDTRLTLEHATLRSGRRQRLLGLRLLFRWKDSLLSGRTNGQAPNPLNLERASERMHWLGSNVIEDLQARVRAAQVS